MTTLGAYIIARNEENLIEKCISLLLPYVDELVLINHGSKDKTKELMLKFEKKNSKVKYYEMSYEKPVDMGKVRTFCIKKIQSDWFLACDADELYPKDSMQKIRQAIENPEQAISFRVPYHNLAWRFGYKQDNFEHYPDRLYKREVIDFVGGVLPNDMTHVKKEFYQHRPHLEYDNPQDKSFENPKQPIIQAPFYHLARTRGFSYEYKKWFTYNKNFHPDWSDEKIENLTKQNQWVTGLYDIAPFTWPTFIEPIRPQKVSIIIPNFQYRNYVSECIESCLNQTVKPYEIIVVDDGSHDDSVSVIKKYPVTLIQQKNQGVACARNAGIKKATGDYFVCVDADDKLHPQYIEKTLQMMTGDTQIVFTDMHTFGDLEMDHQLPDFSSLTLKQAQCIPSACALIDMRCFYLSGGFDNSEYYEDYGFWLRLDQRGFKFKQIREPLFLYRKHGKSRIDMLDEKQEYGFQQLNERYGKII